MLLWKRFEWSVVAEAASGGRVIGSWCTGEAGAISARHRREVRTSDSSVEADVNSLS